MHFNVFIYSRSCPAFIGRTILHKGFDVFIYSRYCSSSLCRVHSGRGRFTIFLSLIALSKYCLSLSLLIHFLQNIYTSTLGSNLPLFLLPFICLVSIRFSKPFFLIMYARKFSCLFLIGNSVFLVSIFSKTSSVFDPCFFPLFHVSSSSLRFFIIHCRKGGPILQRCYVIFSFFLS